MHVQVEGTTNMSFGVLPMDFLWPRPPPSPKKNFCRRHCCKVMLLQVFILPLISSLDVDVPSPDEKSVITYVSSIYDAFPKIPEGGEGIAAHVPTSICYLLIYSSTLWDLPFKKKKLLSFCPPSPGGGPALVRVSVQILFSASVEPAAHGPHGQQELPTEPSRT